MTLAHCASIIEFNFNVFFTIKTYLDKALFLEFTLLTALPMALRPAT